jgi:hypothetical protein
MTTSAPLNTTTGALVTTPAGALAPGGAPRHVAPVVLSFDAANYYMKASLRRAGLIGHVDGTVAIDEDVADMVLSSDQTARQLWLAVHELFSAN